MGKVKGYIRVSTDRQDVANQRAEILGLANERGLGRVLWTEETISGRVSWKSRALGRLIEGLEAGDTVIVAELSRLGRSMLEIMEILAISTERKIRIYAVKGGWELDGSMQAKIVAMVLAMASEIERDLISQRTRAALATKKAAGVRLGRPKGPGKSRLDTDRDRILEEIRAGMKLKAVANRYKVDPSTLARWLKKQKSG